MRARGCLTLIWRFMVIFSFIVNFVLVAVLIGAGLLIFEIKGQVADPLIGGLHSTAVGLNNSTIDWTIPVDTNLPINLDVPINAQTITSQVTNIGGQAVDPIAGETLVTLTRPVPISINNAFIQSNDLTLRNATVNITLPAGTQLPVALNLGINLETEIPVNLDVRAVIPISETQLADPISTLGLLFEPLALGLHNLPNNFGEAGDFATQIIENEEPFGEFLTVFLLDENGNGFNTQAYIPWAGYSRTAGVNYPLFGVPFPPENRPLQTGLVEPGGIPALDQLVRPEVYDEEGNLISEFSAQAIVPIYTYDGTMAGFILGQNDTISVPTSEEPPATGGPTTEGNTSPDVTNGNDNSGTTNDGGLGIIPTPGN